MPEETKIPVKKRRFLSSDYDFIAEFIENDLGNRKADKFRKDHEALWTEVDRQVSMKPMEVIAEDPDDKWRAALELGDLSTASEVLSADALRLIFPQDRSWMLAHNNINFKRLAGKDDAQGKKKLSKKQRGKVQKQADAELRAFMTQQHKDFGLRSRIGLSLKESLHHGSFVAEIQWEEQQQYSLGGVFESAAAPVWVPHSMWNCYPELGNLGTNLIYTGSMIIESEKDFDWVMRQTNFINLKKFKSETSNTKNKVQLKTYFGNINVERKGDSVYLPNMKFIVANKVVIFAQPMDNVSIIYGGYDRLDVRDVYYMSPLIKQSSNHKIATIIANKFIDNVELKLNPPSVYDGTDPVLVAQGGPKMIPGAATPTKGGVQNFKQIDVGDPSWAAQALSQFKQEVQEGTSVSTPRAGGQRQADRVTATQIEEESAGSEIRTVDFVDKIEKGILAYLYIQHEMNKKKLDVYVFYNPEMGMSDFGEIRKKDLLKQVHFEIVGSKGVLTERRRAEATSAVTTFLMSNDRTVDLVNVEEVAKQMYMDAGNKNPERLLLIADDDNDAMKKKIEAIEAKFQEMIQELQGKLQEVTQKLTSETMKSDGLSQRLTIQGDKSQGTENHLRDTIQDLKQQIRRNAQFLEELGKIKDETLKQEKLQNEIETSEKINAASLAKEDGDKGDKEPTEQKETNVIVNIEKAGGFNVKRDPATGDMSGVVAVEAAEVVGE